jgi:hypothetical protein
MADINARRVYRIGGPQAVRLCVCVVAVEYGQFAPMPRVVAVGDDGMSFFIPCWQGLWILIRSKGRGWLRLLGGPVQSCRSLGEVKVSFAPPHRSRGCAEKTMTPVGRSVERWSGTRPLAPHEPSTFFFFAFCHCSFSMECAQAGE